MAAYVLIFVTSLPNVVPLLIVDFDDKIKRIELVAVVLFLVLVSALLYVSADVVRIKSTGSDQHH